MTGISQKEKAVTPEGGQVSPPAFSAKGGGGADLVCKAQGALANEAAAGPREEEAPPPDVTVPQGRRRGTDQIGPFPGRVVLGPSREEDDGPASWAIPREDGRPSCSFPPPQGSGAFFRGDLAALAVGCFERDTAQRRSVEAQVGQFACRERLQFNQCLTIDTVSTPCFDDILADFVQTCAEAHAVGDRAVARYICHFHHFLAWAGQRRIALWLRWEPFVSSPPRK